MRHELSRKEEEHREIPAGASAEREESTEAIRQEFSEISPSLGRIAYDDPPKLTREQWARFSEQLQEELRKSRGAGWLRLWWQSLRDGLRATDSHLWRASQIILLFGALLLLLLAIYAAYWLLKSPSSSGTVVSALAGVFPFFTARGFLLSQNRRRSDVDRPACRCGLKHSKGESHSTRTCCERNR